MPQKKRQRKVYSETFEARAVKLALQSDRSYVACLGKYAGDVVEILIPRGLLTLKILDIAYR